MTRKQIALAAGGATLLAGSASAFDGWYYCPPPRYYYPPPVAYYYPPIYYGPAACPPSLPMTLPKDRVPPKPMPGGEAPKPKVKEEKSGVAPAEFQDVPKVSSAPAPFPKPAIEHATPSPAPPPPSPDKKPEIPAAKPAVELAVPTIAPPPSSEKKPETPATATPKTVDIPLPMFDIEPTKPAGRADVPKLSVPEIVSTEPGKIPPLTVPLVPPKKDESPVVPGGIRAVPTTGGLRIPPIDIPPPAAPAPVPEKKSTSGSSPLANVPVAQTISVKALSGFPPASGRYTVRFLNETGTALTLTVESGSIVLPGKHYVDVQIGREFTWKAGEGPSRKAEVPTDAAGLEIAVKP